MTLAKDTESPRYKAGKRISNALSEADIPREEGKPVRDAFGLMEALVNGATNSGYCFAHPLLIRRYMWWDDTFNKRKVEAWISTLVEWGEITIEPLGVNVYDLDEYFDVIVIQNKRRFHRWRARPSFTAAQRVEVYARDGGACRHCGSIQNLSIDHIVAWSKGGAHSLENFQTLCRSCNSRKGDR